MTLASEDDDVLFGGVAMWRRVADAIRLDIVGGKLVRGDRLAGETTMASAERAFGFCPDLLASTPSARTASHPSSGREASSSGLGQRKGMLFDVARTCSFPSLSTPRARN